MYASNPGPQWEKSICIPQLSNRVGRRFVISARVACIDFSHSSYPRPISQARSTHQSRSWRVPALMPAQSDQVTSCGCSVNPDPPTCLIVDHGIGELILARVDRV